MSVTIETGRVLTCVYCGQAYPQDTPAWGNDILTEHIKICPKHPMRKAEADIALLRGALAGLVGASTKEELERIELGLRIIPVPEADRIAALNGIHALLATIPVPAGNRRPMKGTPRTDEWYSNHRPANNPDAVRYDGVPFGAIQEGYDAVRPFCEQLEQELTKAIRDSSISKPSWDDDVVLGPLIRETYSE